MSNNMILYYDVNTDNLYNEVGSLYGANTPRAYLDNTVSLEIHYVTDTNASTVEEWTPWTGLAGIGVSSSLAFDTDYLHATAGTLYQAATTGDTQVQVAVSISEVMLNLHDTLVLYRSDRTPVAVPYSSFVIGSEYITFTLVEALSEDFAVDTDVRVPQALLLKVSGDDVDTTNAQNGVFVFNMYLMSYRILQALDYSDTQGLSGTMEHKIMSDGNTINTFHIPFFVANMMDYETTAEIPSTSNVLVTTDYVDSKVSAAIVEVSAPLVMQYSSNNIDWHDAYTTGDIYVRRKAGNPYALWSEGELLAPVELVVKSINYEFTTTDGQESALVFSKTDLGISSDTEPDVSLWAITDDGKLKVTDTSYTAVWTDDSLTITYQTVWTAGTWIIKLS